VYNFLYNMFHRHTWSSLKQNTAGTYIMRCCDCGVERVVKADLSVSSEIQRRLEEARSTLKSSVS
jgi:hypothetical protein